MARLRFQQQINQTQGRIEHWAKHGSEPRTRRERILRALLKIWELADDLGSSWDRTQPDFENAQRRVVQVASRADEPEAVIDRLLPNVAQTKSLLNQIDEAMDQALELATSKIAQWSAEADYWPLETLIASVVGFFNLLIEINAEFVRVQQLIDEFYVSLLHLDLALSTIELPAFGEPEGGFHEVGH